MKWIDVTPRQTPTFYGGIKSGATWFDASTDLATQAELTAEFAGESTVPKPIRATVYKTTATNKLAASLNGATAVSGWSDVEIASTAFLEPASVSAAGVDYNFAWTPDARKSFPFATTGLYIVDFLIYPKSGPALAFDVGVRVV